MLVIAGIRNCDTVKKALKWVESKGITYVFRDLKKNPFSYEELVSITSHVTPAELANKRGLKWRSLGFGTKPLRDTELLKILQEHQTAIKRPVFLLEGYVLVGFDSFTVENILLNYP